MSLKYVFEILKLAKVVRTCPETHGCVSMSLLQDVIRTCLGMHGCIPMSYYLFTRAPAPPMIASTSSLDAIDVSPGVVIARAPCAAP